MTDKRFYARNGLEVASNTRMIVPVGNTGQRPSVPQAGDLRFNSETGAFEGYFASNSTWSSVASTVIPPNLSVTTLQSGNTTISSWLLVGNSTVNTFVNSSAQLIQNSTVVTTLGIGSIAAGANVVLNTTSLGIGNSTVSSVVNATHVVVGNTVVNTTFITLGNTTVNVQINSTSFTGAAASANNAAYLGGVAAASYATTASLSAYQTTAGLSANVAGLTANNAAYLGGIAAANYWKSSGAGALTNLNQLTNGPGYITTLSSGTSYSCYTMTAGNYLYSSGNIYAVGDVYAAYSDRRLKTLIYPVEDALYKVTQLQAWRYHRNDLAPELGDTSDKRIKVGLIAQDVQNVMPEAVGPIMDAEGNSTEYLTIQYERLVPLLVEAIKELRSEVAQLRAKVETR